MVFYNYEKAGGNVQAWWRRHGQKVTNMAQRACRAPSHGNSAKQKTEQTTGSAGYMTRNTRATVQISIVHIMNATSKSLMRTFLGEKITQRIIASPERLTLYNLE